MRDEFLISRNDAENFQKIFFFYKESANCIPNVQRVNDEKIERLFHSGARPKAGLINDPDKIYTEKAHLAAMIKKVNPALLPQEWRGMLNPAATLFEWVFKRLCMDIKWLAQVNEEHMSDYILLIDDDIVDSNKEMATIKAKHQEIKDDLTDRQFMALDPEIRHYFCLLVNVAALQALSSILKTIYAQWYASSN